MKKGICALLALVMIIASVCSCAPAETEKTAVFSGKLPVLERDSSGFSLYTSSLEGRLRLYNKDCGSVKVVLYSSNGKMAELSAALGEAVSAKGIGGELCAAAIEADGVRRAYALDKTGLDLLLGSSEAEITVPGSLAYSGDLIISRPVTIRGTLEADNIYCISELEGELRLEGSFTCGLFAASAPNMDIIIPSRLMPESRDMYICAASVNGESAEKSKRTVESWAELSVLLSRPAYYQPEKETIVLCGFEIKDELSIDFPCSLDATNAVVAGGISFETEEAGTIEIKGDIPAEKIKMDAPDCELFLEHPMLLHEAGKYLNVKSLNGYDAGSYSLGGQCGDRILSARMSSDGALLTEDIVWRAEGNVLKATVSGVAAPSQLKNAILSFETENGGSVEIEAPGKGEGGTVDLLQELGTYALVCDGEGNERRYLIETEICSKLPVVVIETETGENVETRYEYINGTMSVESDYTGLPSEEKTDIQIKGRGNSTWYWSDKTPYKVKYKSNVSLLGLREGKEWVLLANYNDKSLIRNYVALEAAKVLDNMECYATQYPCDVFVCGEYMGVYSLGEQIEVSGERASLYEDATDVDAGYFLEIGGKPEFDGEDTFTTSYMECVQILEPGEGELTEKNKTYIVNYMKMADEAVRSLKGYEAYIDIDSLIDWFILTELSFNSDGAMRRSVFILKDHGGKLRMGPAWDYDLAFGNNGCDYNNYSAWCCLATDYGYVSNNWMCRLMEDEAFVQRLRERWNEIKVPLEKNVNESIDLASSLVAHSAKANFERWDILSVAVGMQPAFIEEYNTYDSQIEFLRDFISHRINWIDNMLNKTE